MQNDGSLNLSLIVKDWRYLLDSVEWRLRHLQDISQDPDKQKYFPDISEEIDRLEVIKPLLKKELERFGKYELPPY